MEEKVLGGVVDCDLTSGDVSIDFLFAGLPVGSPEPRLGRGDGCVRAQLYDSVVSFGDLHLGTGLVQSILPTQRAWQRQQSA